MSIIDKKHGLVLEVMRMSAQCRNVEDLDRILDGPLKELLRYEVMVCSIAFSTGSGGYGHKYHSRDYPIEYFSGLEKPGEGLKSPLMDVWLKSLKPVYFQSGRDDHLYPAEWVKRFNKFDLRNTVAHATVDRSGVLANCFIFARLEGEVGADHAEVLDVLIPNLGQALGVALETEVIEGDFPGAAQHLISNRQREILHWIYHGKTNWEISKILEISEETIKYHVEHAMTKLNVKTRAQAVGRALELGLISDKH